MGLRSQRPRLNHLHTAALLVVLLSGFRHPDFLVTCSKIAPLGWGKLSTVEFLCAFVVHIARSFLFIYLKDGKLEQYQKVDFFALN